jgi:aminoglycoside 6'-N-acetyltransferase
MGDLETFLAYRQDPEVARYQSWEPSYSREQAADLIQSQAEIEFPQADQWLQLGLHLVSSGKLVGDLALHALDEKNVFEIGFTIARQHQGFGYAKEAASKLLEYLFREASASKVFATCDRRNQPSINLLRKLGFQQQLEKTWVEEFKGETVTVDYFETTGN